MTSGGFQLRSRTLGPLPLINAFLTRLRVDHLLADAVVDDPRSRLAASVVLGVVLRSVIEGRLPLYALSEWAADRDHGLLGLPPPGSGELLNDDRVGRALERLFDADRAQLQTSLVVHAIRRFHIDCSEFHNDSTSITFTGNYTEATGQPRRGQPTARIARGHNKDHRDDLKQLLWTLTVAADGAVPVHYAVDDGNTGDTETHCSTWDLLHRLAGRADFLYVADSKLCTRENMAHIAERGGRFLTVMPRSRKEDGDLRAWIQTRTLDWVLVRHGSARDGRSDDYLMAEAPWPSSDGHRVVWVLSTAKARRDAEVRQSRIVQASTRLEELRERLVGPKARIRTKAGADEKVRAILAETGAADWLSVTLEESAEPRYRQSGPGRPGTATTYRRNDRVRVVLTWQVREEQVAYEARSDGMFPLITNCRDLDLGQLLDRYKYQPRLERRHEQLKSGLQVAPMWLKNIDRIEAFLFLDFIALLVRALIEREVRRRMKDEDIAALPIYPEDRHCSAPTAERILTIFSAVQRHELVDGGQVVQTFEPELTVTQRRVLRLLDLSPAIYRSS
jgi:transposase